jgi:hypothetical protein
VQEVKALLGRPPLPGCRLVVDATGVGRAVVDLLRQAELPAMLVPITITAGHAAAREKDGYHVAKKHLAGVLQVLLQQQRLKVSELSEREVLLREMRAFRVKVVAATGHETFEAWRERDHDDLVLSVALACWLAERGTKGPLLRVLPFGKPREKQLRVVVCSQEELAALALEQPCLLVSIADPPPVGTSALPPHALPKLLGSLDRLDHPRDRPLARAGQRLRHGGPRLGERPQHLEDAGEDALHPRRQQDVHLRVLLAHDRPGHPRPARPLLRLLAGAELQPRQRLVVERLDLGAELRLPAGLHHLPPEHEVFGVGLRPLGPAHGAAQAHPGVEDLLGDAGRLGGDVQVAAGADEAGDLLQRLRRAHEQLAAARSLTHGAASRPAGGS